MSYLNKNGLNEVIVLIKYLGATSKVRISKENLNEHLGVKNNNVDYWFEKAISHPEFFIALNNNVSLFTREENPQSLNLSQINELVNMAISLQQAEIFRKQRNSWLVPILIAIISSGITLFTIFYKMKNNIENQVKISEELNKIHNVQSDLLEQNSKISSKQDTIIKFLKNE